MGDWQTLEIGRFGGVRDANPVSGVTATCGAANTKGAFAYVDNAPFDSCGIVLVLNQQSSTNDYLVDIALGPAGSESIVINDVLVTAGASGVRSKSFYFPLQVPVNTRLSIRAQNATLSSTIVANITWMQEGFGGHPSFAKFHTYGALIATSTGVALAAPGANAWGAWTQMTDRAAYDHGWLMPIVGDLSLVTRTAGSRFAYQSGVGASGSEFPNTPAIWFSASSTQLGLSYYPGWWVPVPFGQRLAMRYAVNAATNLGASATIIAGVK